MNTATRHALDSVPTPFEDGYPVRCMAVLRAGAWRTAWGFDGCRRPEPFGPAYAGAREAAAASRYLNQRSGAEVAA